MHDIISMNYTRGVIPMKMWIQVILNLIFLKSKIDFLFHGKDKDHVQNYITLCRDLYKIFRS